MSLKRTLLAGLAVIILAPAMLLGVLVARFDPNDYAPAIARAVQRATGRTVTFGSPIRFVLSLTPTIQADNVTLSNPAGFADANLITLSHVEAKISLSSLLSKRVDILNLLLVKPDIRLQSLANGQSDWDFTGAAGQQSVSLGGYKLALETVEIQNASIVFEDASGKPTQTLVLQDATGTADTVSAPLKIAAQASVNNVPVTLNGIVGPVERFSGIGDGPWPVNLTLNAAGAALNITGNVARPRKAAGYQFTLSGNIPALEALSPLLPPGVLVSTLPAIHGVTASAIIADQGAAMPAIRNLSIQAASSDLSSLRPGLTLTNLVIGMASLNAPVTINTTGSIGPMPLSLTGSLGSLARLLNPAWLPATAQPSGGNFPVVLQAQAGNATLTVSGGIATPASLAGVALAVNVTIPDLSALAPLAGQALPAWKNILAQGSIIDPGGLGLGQAAGLDGLTLTMDNAALGGDASLYFEKLPRLQVALKAQQINLDGLLATLPTSNPTTPAAAPAATPATATPPTLPGTLVVPTTPLPTTPLQSFNADIQLAADSLVYDKATYTALQGHAVLQNGVLSINPFTGILPGGDVSATASLDTNQNPAAANWTLNAPALALAPLLQAFNQPGTAEGTLQVSFTGSGTGNSLHDILASMNSQLGVASVNGAVDSTVLETLFGPALRVVNLPDAALMVPGQVPLRCFALRADTTNGLTAITALTLDSNRMQVQGGGQIKFADETLGIVLLPQLLPVGVNPAIPVEIGGTLANPLLQSAPQDALHSAAATAPGLQTLLMQQVSGVATPTIDICPAALALGRLGKPGPAATPLAAAMPAAGSSPVAGGPPPQAPASPKNLLNSLLGQ
ncbi:MAG: hypothetical protein B7Z75_01315 [Acidocella sp. 20-57-95]|nr:MAG: hypothetical protein B7Z75_01315 [Acidocella sp. 20-57-95]OYV61043.1 MAG: hypothetical protein B7Z71_05260 [Acidocella sp. 21-58-7]HQT65096.1 AsmA family protein [Acidocella sp.]HQU04111.1 AsmA family protein [Acidocella sp.]